MGLGLYDQDVYVVKTAGELLFDGYEDNMVLMGKQLFDASEVPFDRVGWFYTVGLIIFGNYDFCVLKLYLLNYSATIQRTSSGTTTCTPASTISSRSARWPSGTTNRGRTFSPVTVAC